MSLINKIRNENFKNLRNLRPHKGTNIESFVIDFASYKRNELDFDVFLPSKNMNLQRGHVWTLSQKQELIRSIILGRTINMFTIIIQKLADKSQKIEVIDGKQRMTAIIEFLRGEFEVDGYYHKDFGYEFKTNLDLKATVYYSYDGEEQITDTQKIELFKLLNFGGTPQDKEHLMNLSK